MSLDQELREAFLTSALTEEQRSELEEVGREVHYAEGDTLFVEGEPAELLWILLEGEIDLFRTAGGEEALMVTMTTPGQWAGGLIAWGEGAGYRATGRAVTWAPHGSVWRSRISCSCALRRSRSESRSSSSTCPSTLRSVVWASCDVA